MIQAILMSLEMVGPRLLAPYFGVTSFTWMCLIGMVLFSMALGYYVGGWLFLNRLKFKMSLFLWIILAALSLLVLNISKHWVLELIVSIENTSTLSKTLLSSILLFSIPSILLSIVSVWCSQEIIDKGGQSKLGLSFGISTLGALCGVFFSSLVLIPYIGSEKILFVLSGGLMVLSIPITSLKKSSLTLMFLLLGNVYGYYSFGKTTSIIDQDSLYQRILVYESKHNQKPIRVMQLNNAINGAIYTQQEGIVYTYNQALYDCISEKKNKSSILFLGGGALTLPSYVQKKHPKLVIDVVELDAKVITLAYEKFNADSNLNIYLQDARAFLNDSHKTYDVIVWDVFTSLENIPDHLSTLETIQALDRILKSDGIILANILGSKNGAYQDYLACAQKTYLEVFKNTSLYYLDTLAKDTEYQNFILKASHTQDSSLFHKTPLFFTQEYKPSGGFLLTDDFSPFSYRLGR